MIRLNVHEAKTHLSKYLAKLEKGETILLCRRNQPIAEIRPLAAKRNSSIATGARESTSVSVKRSIISNQWTLMESICAGWIADIPLKPRRRDCP